MIVQAFFEREVKRLLYTQERKKIRVQDKTAHEAAQQEALAVLFYLQLHWSVDNNTIYHRPQKPKEKELRGLA